MPKCPSVSRFERGRVWWVCRLVGAAAQIPFVTHGSSGSVVVGARPSTLCFEQERRRWWRLSLKLRVEGWLAGGAKCWSSVLKMRALRPYVEMADVASGRVVELVFRVREVVSVILVGANASPSR